MEFKHIPVMLNEVIDGLNIKKDGIYIDCTIGGGGHSSEIAKSLDSNGHLYGFDRDENAVKASSERLSNFSNVTIIRANFKEAKEILEKQLIFKVDGILIDLGVSSHQIDEGERGFSFVHNGRLDMRMDRRQKLTAYDIVNKYSRDELKRIFYEYGEEEFTKPIVENILKSRANKPIETTFELKEIIENSMPKKVVFSRGGASKKVFQALRIEVNCELEGLKETISNFIDMLNPNGRIAILTFHSLEDRIVKTIFKEKATDCICPPKTPICICGHKAEGKLVNRKPILASKEELEINSRSSCAKLRVFEKI